MNKQAFLQAALLIALLSPPGGTQAGERDDGARFLPDVPGQFRALTERADPLGLHITTTPNPSACKHYQAITRVDGADGTPFFLVTRSGNTPETFPGAGIICDDSPNETDNGHLIVFRMDSRDKHGERMRSNRLRKGVHINSTPPDAQDRATIYFTFVGGDPADPDPAKRPGLVFRDGEDGAPARGYQHPGGMQLIGEMLAVALESPRAPAVTDPEYDPPATLIMFFDVSIPEEPLFASQFAPTDENGAVLGKAGVVGVTPLPGGRYLMVVAGGDGATFFFYRSTLHVNGLRNPELSWEFVGTVPGPDTDDDADFRTTSHQTLQFLRQGDINGPLYLAGARGDAISDDRDRVDLYLLECDTPDCAPGEEIVLTTRYRGQRISPYPNTGGTRLANLAAGSGFHITPSGELLFYATEHDNDGPGGSVKAGEWRHKDIVREGSPTLLPSVAVGGPYYVDEGSSVGLSGSAKPPITKPWIQLFHGTDFGSYYPVVDFDDYASDDYDNFFALEFQFVLTHNDKARSWKWFAPVGCSILATDYAGVSVDETRTLAGTGSIQQVADLKSVLNDGGTDDIDQEIDAVEFLDDCNQYYATPFNLQWDLDVNGSYETTGTLVTLSAAAFDGPSTVNIPVQTLGPSTGPSAQTTATVNVINVAPQLAQFSITNGTGQVINIAVPFVLTGLPVTAGAVFSDPGVLDHQTATIVWGDGSVESQTAFVIFDEAFGDGMGAAAHTHRYTLGGSYPVTLTVRDDDGGESAATADLRVVTPAQAVAEIIGLLDGVISSTASKAVVKELQKARKALAGSVANTSNNGALNKIKNGNHNAAVAFLQDAIKWLQVAKAGGADVAVLITLLEQVIAALAAA